MEKTVATSKSGKDSRRNQEDDIYLLKRIRLGDTTAIEVLIKVYYNFVRLKAHNYFITGGEEKDLVQEGLIGLHKAIRDYNEDKGASFRSFVELCITRQIITAIKTASRQKHLPLNSSVSINASVGLDNDSKCTLGDILPTNCVYEPDSQVIAREEENALREMLHSRLCGFEEQILKKYLEGYSYQNIANFLGISEKSVDNALQRIKRKVDSHLEMRQIIGTPDGFKEHILVLIRQTKAGGVPYRILKKRSRLNGELENILDDLSDTNLIVLVAGLSQPEDIFVAIEYFDNN